MERDNLSEPLASLRLLHLAGPGAEQTTNQENDTFRSRWRASSEWFLRWAARLLAIKAMTGMPGGTSPARRGETICPRTGQVRHPHGDFQNRLPHLLGSRASCGKPFLRDCHVDGGLVSTRSVLDMVSRKNVRSPLRAAKRLRHRRS